MPPLDTCLLNPKHGPSFSIRHVPKTHDLRKNYIKNIHPPRTGKTRTPTENKLEREKWPHLAQKSPRASSIMRDRQHDRTVLPLLSESPIVHAASPPFQRSPATFARSLPSHNHHRRCRRHRHRHHQTRRPCIPSTPRSRTASSDRWTPGHLSRAAARALAYAPES